MLKKQKARFSRKNRISKSIAGSNLPRLSIYRSNSNIYAQIIDDVKGVTLVSASDLKEENGTKIERAQVVGKAIADLAKKEGIEKVVFDRNGFLYHGRVKVLADSARENGLIF